MAGLVARLPDPGVGSPPVRGDEVGQRRQLLRPGGAERPRLRPEAPRAFQQRPVRVELQLVGGGVAVADGRRVLVAGQRELLLVESQRAVDAVERLQLRLAHPRRVHLPPEERAGLVLTAELEKRAQRVHPVAQPAEAVVPVAVTADPLGERGRGRSDNAARGREGEQLECERAPNHEVAPGTVVGETGAPICPERCGLLDPSLRVGARREDEWLALSVREGKGGPSTRLHGEGTVAGIPARERERMLAVDGDERTAATALPKFVAPEVEARLEAPAQGHSAVEPVDDAHELPERRERARVVERSASVTRAVPDSVRNVVSSTFVSVR